MKLVHRFNYVCDDCNDKVIGVTYEEFIWHRRGMFLKCLCRGKHESKNQHDTRLVKNKLSDGASNDSKIKLIPS